jgi:DNA processing protein
LRNRVISGLSRAVVVIEASDKSGSLITARAALDQGRDVLAVPGSVASGRYRGGHALIKDGARLVETVEDVLEEIGWARRAVPAAGEADKELIISDLERIMAPGESYTLDDLAVLTGQAAPALLAELAALELAGRVVRVGGGNFAKT